MNWIWGQVPRGPHFDALMVLVGVSGSLAAAEGLYRFIEGPAVRLSQRIRYAG